MGNAQLLELRSRELHPPLWFPDVINPDKGATSSLLSAGAIWEDWHGHLLHRTSIVNFISREKEFSKAIKCFFGLSIRRDFFWRRSASQEHAGFSASPGESGCV
jgi:hypothetical protein